MTGRDSVDEGADPDQRRPRSVYGVGTDPDVRFSLANERTALAWLRTGLGLVAGGIALTSFASFADLSVLLDVVAAVACVGGGCLAAYALVAWRRNERAMRLGTPLPPPSALPVIVVGVVAFAALVGAYAIWSGSTR
ncbi:YidH family protein [Luteimicrobium sp. DT211]|uniref:YidH family protein n=1 Tax=Luteimicrobium sp. DT211 TaxID=3393412 RepID=UPI003CEE1E0D